MATLLSGFLTPDNTNTILNSLPPLASPILDTVYKRTVLHPSYFIGVSDYNVRSGNIPLTSRGGTSYGMSSKLPKIDIVQPPAITPSTFIDAAELNQFKGLTGANKQTVINNKIDQLRRAVRATTEALAGQALSGNISYGVHLGGSYSAYQYSFGEPLSHTSTKKWGDAATKLTDIIADLQAMIVKMQPFGFGTDVVFMLSWASYNAVLGKIDSNTNIGLAQIDSGEIVLGGAMKLKLVQQSYTDFMDDDKVKNVIDEVVAVDLAADHKLIYAAVDDVDNNLQALPFVLNEKNNFDPSGVKLIGRSCPFPLPVIKAIVKAKVL